VEDKGRNFYPSKNWLGFSEILVNTSKHLQEYLFIYLFIFPKGFCWLVVTEVSIAHHLVFDLVVLSVLGDVPIISDSARRCWRKICTSRQAHSKPNKLASHAKRSRDVPVNFPWKLTKDKVVKFQSLELVGWYQTVPYLRLESQVRWHIAIESYLPTNCNYSGALECKK
jgi:hypothetical protein